MPTAYERCLLMMLAESSERLLSSLALNQRTQNTCFNPRLHMGRLLPARPQQHSVTTVHTALMLHQLELICVL